MRIESGNKARGGWEEGKRKRRRSLSSFFLAISPLKEPLRIRERMENMAADQKTECSSLETLEVFQSACRLSLLKACRFAPPYYKGLLIRKMHALETQMSQCACRLTLANASRPARMENIIVHPKHGGHWCNVCNLFHFLGEEVSKFESSLEGFHSITKWFDFEPSIQ